MATINKSIDKLALIHLKDKKLLCARSKGVQLFYFVGGKREPGETDSQALTREIREELGVGIIPETIKFVGASEAQADRKPEGVMVKLTCYSAKFTGKPKPKSEIEEIAYLSYAEKQKVAKAGWQMMDKLKEDGLLD